MGVYVRFGRRKAFLRRGIWVSSDAGLEHRLNRMTADWIERTGGPPVGDPDPDLTTAEVMSVQADGRVTRRVKPATRRSAEIYMSLRQLKLDL